MSTNDFKQQYKLTEEQQKQAAELNKYKHYLATKIGNYTDTFINAHSEDVKEYMDYLASAIFLKFKQYYPNLSIYEPFRAKSDMSFIRNVKKELKKQFVEGDSLELNDDSIISDINAITVVLDHINRAISVNPDYDYRNNEEINNLIQQSNEIEAFINEHEYLVDGILSKQEFLEYKKEILNKILELNFDSFTTERTPSYQNELNDVKQSIHNLEDDASYASNEEVLGLKNLLQDLRSKLDDKSYHTLLPQAFEDVMNDPIFKKFHIEFKFVKDSKKSNGFAANYYVLKTPFGNIEVQLQSAKRYYESRKGSASHNSIPGKDLDIKDLFELVNPDDPKPLEFYLNYLDKTPVTKILYDTDGINPNSPEHKESERIQKFMQHIKLKDYYESKISDEEGNSIKTPIDEVIYKRAILYSPYMGICRSAHTNFRNVDIIHRNRVSSYSDILRKIDSLSCLGDIVISRLNDYIKNPENNLSEPDTDKVTEIGIQSIYRYLGRLEQMLTTHEDADISNTDDNHTL